MIMSLEEEIIRQEEKSMSYKSLGNQLSMNYSPEQQLRAMEDYYMSDYHRQLANWLRELQRYEFEISECKAILDNPTPDVTENDRKRAMYVLQTFPDVGGKR